jgi:hypothetical protein
MAEKSALKGGPNSEQGIESHVVRRGSQWSADAPLQGRESTGPGMPGASYGSAIAGSPDRQVKLPKKAKGWSAR